jgi:hypothetical protein
MDALSASMGPVTKLAQEVSKEYLKKKIGAR